MLQEPLPTSSIEPQGVQTTGPGGLPESSKATQFLCKIIAEKPISNVVFSSRRWVFLTELPGRGHDFLLPAAHIYPVARSNMVGLRRLLDAIADTLGTPPLH
jgi:hypothetical protein